MPGPLTADGFSENFQSQGEHGKGARHPFFFVMLTAY